MNEDFVLDIANRAIRVTAILGGPMLIGTLVIGIIVSLFQAVTQINEQTLTFIPKIVVVGVCLVLLGPWMTEIITSFTRELIIDIPSIIAGK